jgi:hypothetical protein
MYLLLDTYSCKFSRKNMIICGLHKKVKMKICISINKSNHCSVNWKKIHFHVSHVQSYFFLKTCTSKRQGMYMRIFFNFLIKLNRIFYF